MTETEEKGKCRKCLTGCRKLTTFLLSHVGLLSLVVAYCLMGAMTFEALESSHELEVKRNMTQVREAVTQYLWTMTQNTRLIREDAWLQNTTLRLQEFETDLLRAMKKGGWDGSESELKQQWTFSGALFYSIVVITTIGYGHVTPKTVPGKVCTIFYAILGIPMMLLCLSHIGDSLAKSFRFLYWKVCCYMCTRRPRTHYRYHGGTLRRGRSIRSNPSKQVAGSSRGLKRSASAIRRSARTSQRSADSAYSDSAIFSLPGPGIRRVHSAELVRVGAEIQMANEIYPAAPIINDDNSENHLQRSSRSAEPAFGSRQNLSIFYNKYAEEAITDEGQMMRGPQPFKLRPIKHQEHLMSPERDQDYWDYYYDDYDGSDYEEENIGKRPVPIWLCAALVLGYIIGGAFLFARWEAWSLLDSAYFSFITLTTIGFGDFVPAQRVQNESAEISIALCSLYLLFGISLLAMSFNLVQEEVISNVRLVATRLGIIREGED